MSESSLGSSLAREGGREHQGLGSTLYQSPEPPGWRLKAGYMTTMTIRGVVEVYVHTAGCVTILGSAQGFEETREEFHV